MTFGTVARAAMRLLWRRSVWSDLLMWRVTMNASKLILFLTLAAGTATAIAASEHPAGSPAPEWMAHRADRRHAGAGWVAENETAKRQLEAQGFPQYSD